MYDHWLKTSPKYFKDVASGIKPFEVRIDDRNPRYEAGDVLHLQEYADCVYTGRVITVKVTYVLRDRRFCIEGHCIMGIRLPEPEARALTVEADLEEMKEFYDDLLKHAHEKAAIAVDGYKKQKARTEAFERAIKGECGFCKNKDTCDVINNEQCFEIWQFEEARFAANDVGDNDVVVYTNRT